MPPEESKPVAPVVDEAGAERQGQQAEMEPDESDDEATTTAANAPTEAAGTKKKNKKKKKSSKRAQITELLTGGQAGGDVESEMKKAIGGLTPQQMKELLALNPSLQHELAQASGGADPTVEQTAAMLKGMDLRDIMTGLAAGGKNVKDMGAYKFWQTQPVPRFGDEAKVDEEGPLRIQTVDEVPTEPQPLVAGFEWVTMDLESDEEIKEVYELLNGHYVEDDEAMFRFNYSPAILRW